MRGCWMVKHPYFLGQGLWMRKGARSRQSAGGGLNRCLLGRMSAGQPQGNWPAAGHCTVTIMPLYRWWCSGCNQVLRVHT
jgi:hypothetical protein